MRIFVEVGSRAELRCPRCGAACPGYDARERRWRHLDTMQYRMIVIGLVPRVECPEHGVVQVAVPWAEKGSRFTALFEALVIDWLLEAYVTDDRKQESLGAFYEQLGAEDCAGLPAVVVDMWAPYVASTRAHVPERKIVFDKFHVAKHLGEAVDQTRHRENREPLRSNGLRVARAWAIKEAAMLR